MPRELIGDPILGTWLFALALAAWLIATRRERRPGEAAFPVGVTQELKGLAILAVVLSHVGYFLSSDHRFLFPLSAAAGIGVNVFLVLAGYGLAASAMARPRRALDFCRRHLAKLYRPMWLALAAFLAADWLLAGVARPWPEVARSFAGLFPTADLYRDVDSPLWYFTFIVAWYLLFALLFSPRRPLAGAAALLVGGELLATYVAPRLSENGHLYDAHLLAFPLGVALAAALARPGVGLALRRLRESRRWSRRATLALLAAAAGYLALHGGIGTSWEEPLSLLAVAATLGLFLLKRVELGALSTLGLASYELYLLHWPILSRYGLLYAWLPGWLATALYVPILLGASWLLRRAAAWRPR